MFFVGFSLSSIFLNIWIIIIALLSAIPHVCSVAM